MSTEMLDDYAISVGGKYLDPAASDASVFPHELVRVYPNGVREILSLVDSLNAFMVILENLPPGSVAVSPLFEGNSRDFLVKFEKNVLLVARSSHQHRASREDYPVWVGITVRGGMPDFTARLSGPGCSPAALLCKPRRGERVEVVFAAGDDETHTINLAASVSGNSDELRRKRKKRLEKILARSECRTDNPRLDKALAWAKISIDALVMNQRKKGIFAGLPWFDDYWGRDSFISLPGAALVTGDFADAREILRSFAGWQDTNSGSTTYGRIPNLVTASTMAYNTADGTPRFVMALRDYVRYSGDTAFAAEMWPVVKRSIDGTLKYHTDPLRFLTHDDAETWMDAVGPAGPWSPRGNRANDVQALWYEQLRAGAAMSPAKDKRLTWTRLADSVRRNFEKFVDSGKRLLYDHLRADGTPGRELRPNQLFDVGSLVLSDDPIALHVFNAVTESLVYPYGIASLSQDDDNFHPFHHFPNYVQDAAYHNGIVWTWLSGKWIDIACGYGLPDLAFRVTENMAGQILDRGAVGTLSELIDAAPRPRENEPRLSGAFSQAWSLAEFVRTFYQSYLGVTVAGERPDSCRLVLYPNFPSEVSYARAILHVKDHSILAEFRAQKGDVTINLSSSEAGSDLDVEFDLNRGFHKYVAARGILHPQGTISFSKKGGRISLTGDGSASDSTFPNSQPVPLLAGIKLATPRIREGLPSLKSPPYAVLSHAEIKRENQHARVIANVSDPAGDETYLYPLTPSLQPGSLDITRFRVTSDDDFVYFYLKFRKLSNPGWHPEYGFQLTYAAIAIDKDGIPGSGRTDVGMNSKFILDSRYAFEDIIYVGGGVRVMNDSGKTLAEYVPLAGDELKPLGDAPRGKIEFAVPVKILGRPSPRWNFSVLVGCQDDHGGAGIGEFRTVEATPSEWTGGGKKDSSLPNVYDVILPNPHKE